MPIARSPRIHPTAVISPEAELADDIEVGAYAIIDGPVRIGAGCVIRPHAMVSGPLVMGRGNVVFSGAILGEAPQHIKYNGEPTRLEIGEGNVFREHVTIHRGTTHSGATRIGSHNYLMASSHIAHDCTVGNRCILANGALVAGHCTIEDNVFLSGNSAVHQWVRIGRLALLSGCSGTTKDIPPFIIQQNIDTVVGVNVIGMRRAGMTPAQIEAVRQAYRILFRESLVLPAALARMEQQLGTVDVIQEMIAFLRESHRGVSPVRHRGREAA
jgi:UDP-N-acetylglucosamine acyltransferase